MTDDTTTQAEQPKPKHPVTEAREKAGLTIEQLAKAAGEYRNMVARAESGVAVPFHTANNIARALKMDVVVLFPDHAENKQKHDAKQAAKKKPATAKGGAAAAPKSKAKAKKQSPAATPAS